MLSKQRETNNCKDLNQTFADHCSLEIHQGWWRCSQITTQITELNPGNTLSTNVLGSNYEVTIKYPGSVYYIV